jgi:hypothetical protein
MITTARRSAPRPETQPAAQGVDLGAADHKAWHVMTDDPKRDWLAVPDTPPGLGHNSRAAGVGDTQIDPEARDLLDTLGELTNGYLLRPKRTRHDMLFAAIQGLGLVSTFMEMRGATKHQIAILNHVLMALWEVSKGNHVRWMEPKGAVGRPGIVDTVATLRGAYAGCMQNEMDKGRPERGASLHVLNKIPKNSVAFDGLKKEEVSRGCVTKWRREHCIGKVPDSRMKQAFQAILETEKRRPGTCDRFLADPHTDFLPDPDDE